MKKTNLKIDNLSRFRTLNYFQKYFEFTSVEELNHYLIEIKKYNKDYIILGNGSNIFFSKKLIKTAIVKNKIPSKIKDLGNNLFEVSSSTKTFSFLKFCLSKSLDSFYFLSSVPSTIGGNIAMNAGGGIKSNQFISNYLVGIKILIDGEIKIIKKDDAIFNYRSSKFSGINNIFIVSGIFKLKKKKFDEDPIKKRQDWSKKYQDYSKPNCGSVFKFRSKYVAWIMRGFSVGGAKFSSKTQNWILNKSKSPTSINILIFICKLLNFVFFKKAKLEIIKVK